MFPRRAHLYGYVQLGGALGGTGRLEGLAVHLHGHREDRDVDRAGLREQLVLETRLQLVEPHQSVHGLGRLGLLLRSFHHNRVFAIITHQLIHHLNCRVKRL